MKKKNLSAKLHLRKQSVSNFEVTRLTGGANTDICTGTQPSCAGCDTPTKVYPCPTPTRGDWTCGCPEQ